MKKLYRYLFCKPNIAVGEKLHYHDRTCLGLYFDWGDGLWFIETEIFDISWEVEKFYRKQKLNKQ